jgi:periplasmic copper chaperone A
MRPCLILVLAVGLAMPLPGVAQADHKPGHGHGAAQAQASGAATAGDLTIAGAVARASIGNAPTSAVYMTITTAGAPDRLLGAASPAAQAVELHTSLEQAGVSKMERVESVPIAADAPAKLEPGGVHVMLIGLQSPLEDGTTVPLTLSFEKAGEVTLEVPVSKDIAARGQ